MRSMQVLALVVLASCGPKNWRTQDMLLEGAVVASTIADWNQTVGITRDCREANPIIGECGERVNPHLYFASFLVIQGIVTRLLPPHYRPVIQGGITGTELATVWDNWRN
jgi:hypothetical protein